MSDGTSIQWTDATWNPVHGCTKVSPGCKHCYAERFAERFRGVKGHAFEQGFDVRLVPEALDLPRRWRKPRRVFVNSMSDLFHEAVPDSFIMDALLVMSQTPRHTFQVLTKRAARMRYFFETHREWFGEPPPHVWLGVSVEDRRTRNERIEHLAHTPAAVRFLSCEPLLEDLGDLGLDGTGIRWVIIGGESGPGARPCDVAWIRSLVAQARSVGAAPFVKQLGARVTGWRQPEDRKGGDMDEWPVDLRVREYPEAA